MTATAATDRWRIPAEWERQSAVLLTWPTLESGWSSASLDDVIAEYVELINAIQATTPVIIGLSPGPSVDRFTQQLGCTPGPPRILRLAYRDCWVRDFGPLTRVNGPRLGWLNFRFHNWDGEFAGAETDLFTGALAQQLQVAAKDVINYDWALEGGAIESDGAGTLLIRRSYLQHQYPQRPLDELEAKLLDVLPAQRVLWLSHGHLPGDQTGGHIDLLARFASSGVIVFQGCQDPTHPAYPELAAMARELRQLRSGDGSPYVLHELPLPPLTHSEFAEPLPLSYANFLISNGQVLVPTFGCDTDDDALGEIARAFPDHLVRGIGSRTLINYGGGLHCATLNLTATPNQPDAE